MLTPKTEVKNEEEAQSHGSNRELDERGMVHVVHRFGQEEG